MVRATLTGSFSEWLGDVSAQMAAAAHAGVEAATQGLKLELRQHVSAALGNRAGNMISARVYPTNHKSLRAAGSIRARGPVGGVADRILTGFTIGATITGGTRNNRTGYWLAIPTDNVPVLGAGVAVTPAAVRAYFGRDLRFISPRQLRKPFGLLLMDNTVKSRASKAARPATRRRRAQGRAVRSVVMFILLPQVRLPRKLNPGPILERWAAAVPDLIARATPSSR